MSATRALVTVQVSVDDTQPSGAVLTSLGSYPALELQLRRLQPLAARAGAQLVVLTTDRTADQPIVDIAAALGWPVVRGAIDDPLGTYAVALVRYEADVVVRVTGDSPLHDPFVVMAALELHRTTNADYTTNLLPRTYPRGLDVEVLAARTLRAIELEATEPSERRRVTEYARLRPDRFRFANLASGHDLAEEDWTLGTEEGLDHLRTMITQIPDPLNASWNRILSVVGRQAKPKPDEVTLHPERACDAGADPWVRRWSVLVNGNVEGTVTVSNSAGRSERTFQVSDEWIEPARAALYRLLLDENDPTGG